MKWLVISTLLCMSMLCQSQSASTLMGGRTAGMGYASAVLKDESAFFNNPGAMAGNKASTFFAYEVRPELPGANRMAAGIQIPVLMGIAGFGVFRFGDDLYNEQLVSVGFGNQIGITSLGIKVNYIQYHTEGFGTKSAIGLDFGGLAQVTPDIVIGAYIINLNQSEISTGERIPTRLVAAVGFQLDEDLFLASEVEKDIDYPAIWRTGIEYILYKKVFVRSGFAINPGAFHAGLGARMKRLKVDYALQFSTVLGESHQASATLQLTKPGK